MKLTPEDLGGGGVGGGHVHGLLLGQKVLGI